MSVQHVIPEESGKPASRPIAEALAHFAAETDHDAIPADVRLRALHHMLDAAGIALASTRFDFAHRVLTGMRGLGGSGEVPVFGMPASLSPRDAAIVNGVLVHGLDYDDTHIGGVLHPTASIFPAVFSAAAHAGASGRAMVTAYIIGVEAVSRLGAVAKGGFHQVGFHPTGVMGAFASALAAGRIFGLTPEQLANAQGTALTMASGTLEFLADGAWNKRLNPGWAAAAGITAAVLAREGFNGVTSPYDGRFGVFNAYLGEHAEKCDLGLATEGLGEVWEMMGTAIKPFPACHFTHGCIDAALVLSRQIDDVGEIDSVEALVAPETFKTICEPEAGKKRPANGYDAQFSTHYLVASALARGRYGLAELEEPALRDAAVLALADKVSYGADPQSPFPKAYSGEVTVKLRDGRTLRHREHINRGADDRPLSNDEIIGKFRANAELAADGDGIERMLGAMLGLEGAPNALAALRPFSPHAAS